MLHKFIVRYKLPNCILRLGSICIRHLGEKSGFLCLIYLSLELDLRKMSKNLFLKRHIWANYTFQSHIWYVFHGSA